MTTVVLAASVAGALLALALPWRAFLALLGGVALVWALLAVFYPDPLILGFLYALSLIGR